MTDRFWRGLYVIVACVGASNLAFGVSKHSIGLVFLGALGLVSGLALFFADEAKGAA